MQKQRREENNNKSAPVLFTRSYVSCSLIRLLRIHTIGRLSSRLPDKRRLRRTKRGFSRILLRLKQLLLGSFSSRNTGPLIHFSPYAAFSPKFFILLILNSLHTSLSLLLFLIFSVVCRHVWSLRLIFIWLLCTFLFFMIIFSRWIYHGEYYEA